MKLYYPLIFQKIDFSIPSRKIIHVWDCNGIEVTSDTIKEFNFKSWYETI